MNAVFYFSCTGHCKALAEILSARLDFELFEIDRQSQSELLARGYSAAVIVFPVHCQSYPKFLKKFFKELNAERVALIAAYGMANAGNALFEAAELVSGKLVAAAYIPVGHGYLNDGYTPSEFPQELLEKICEPSTVTVPRRRKTPFAGFLPSLRSRMLVKITRSESCIGCNKCGEVCPTGAVECGKINHKCVRCLKCVTNCPEGALTFKKAKILSRYLDKANCRETILYLK